MKNIAMKILVLCSVIIMVNTIGLVFVSNFNIGNILVIMLGFFGMTYGVFYRKIDEITKSGFMKIIRVLIIFGITCMFVIIGIIVIGANHSKVMYNEDVLIVLGCGINGDKVSVTLANRLNKAIEYYDKNKNVIIVVSGGQGPQETITEALAMEKYLVDRGIPDAKIIKEERATSTYENFKYSKQILDDYFEDSYQVAYVTNDYHSYRAGGIANVVGLDAKAYNAKTQIYMLPTTYVREVLAVMKFWVFKS